MYIFHVTVLYSQTISTNVLHSIVNWLVSIWNILADKKQKEINTITQISRNDGFPLDMINHLNKGKGKVIPLQARCGPDGG